MNDIVAKCMPDVTPFGIRSVLSIPGVNSVQVTHMIVRNDGVEQEHLIVNTFPLRLDQVNCQLVTEELQPDYPNAIISVLLTDNAGAAEMFGPEGSVKLLTGIAAAISCLKVVCGWDESQEFEIKVNDQVALLQVVGVDDQSWWKFRL